MNYRMAFFLYECFKEDVCHPVVPLNCYPTTLRRRIVDGTGKIVRHCRPDPAESHGRHLEAASNRPALAKERPPAAFRLGLNLKTKSLLAASEPPCVR